ncbi:uncharacterized protein SPSK_00572 [Sporothrix schenckii 1099-18]|uniref:Uncharacterized protein n=1 Tax=Sporothrix schenckii 1099-18 TaxID=1397361 RepID=A0A0F2LTP3_SPOSC|nr:uncharacterized protein SPSK_00572 [Sporothrix schenckii 1099-18]KJR79890.1 hypothetical protein SPSK_00572 [Sporothrix schenckii 1099-18]
MAHIPTSAAIFSPSVARLASSAAKDWNYVDSWLSSIFPNRSPPPFERNSETLRALVTLSTLNESVDEDFGHVSSLETLALRTLSKAEEYGNSEPKAVHMSPVYAAGRIVAAIESELSREGHLAFDALAATSVELGVAIPVPTGTGREFAHLDMYLFQLEQALSRTEVLHAHVGDHSSRLRSRFDDHERDGYRPSAPLARQNLELQRKIKTETSRLQDIKDAPSVQAQLSKPTTLQLEDDETIFLKLSEYDEALCKQINAFRNLPPDTELAKQQLEILQSELQAATQIRDNMFEGLVEKATPKRSR